MDIPSDLLDLQRAFFAAEARCAELAAALPPARELINGTCTMPAGELERLQIELQKARKKRIDLVLAKHQHPWLKEAGQERLQRDNALRAAAKEQQSA